MRYKDLTEQPTSDPEFTPSIYFDMDGVLVDFEGGFADSMGKLMPTLLKQKKKYVNPFIADILSTPGMGMSELKDKAQSDAGYKKAKQAAYIILGNKSEFWENLGIYPHAKDLLFMGRQLVTDGWVKESSILTGGVGNTDDEGAASPSGKRAWLNNNGMMSMVDRFLIVGGGKKFTTFGNQTQPGDILVDDRPQKEFTGKWDTQGYGIYWHPGMDVKTCENQIKGYITKIRDGAKVADVPKASMKR